MNKQKEPLYRKVNTKAHGVHHHSGSDASHDRNTKQGTSKSMKKDKHRGLDYTPLYRFLLSKVGQTWSTVHSEAISRLDKEEPIYHLVALNEAGRDVVRCGESSYYNGLFVDDDGILQIVNTKATNEEQHPICSCCTHTFNGKVFINKFKENVE
jgi:hypothetical protein